MPAPVFIGDEVTATGYHLAGARTLTPAAADVEEVFATALGTTELLFITARCAAQLPKARLDAAMRTAKPLILVVADAANSVVPPDLGLEVDRALGIEA